MARIHGNTRLTPMPVLIEGSGTPFEADLYLPRRPRGAVIFAALGGAHEPFKLAMLEAVVSAELADLTMPFSEDALDGDWEADWDNQDSLARLWDASQWLGRESWTAGLDQGLFGSGALAAPVLRMAADRPELMKAVVIFEGSADMSEADLEEIEIPALFIADSSDPLDAELHEAVAQMLHCESRLVLLDKTLIPPKSAVELYLDHFDGTRLLHRSSPAGRVVGSLYEARQGL